MNKKSWFRDVTFSSIMRKCLSTAIVFVCAYLLIIFSVLACFAFRFLYPELKPNNSAEWAAWFSGLATSAAVVVAVFVYRRDAQWKKEKEDNDVKIYQEIIIHHSKDFIKYTVNSLGLVVCEKKVLSRHSSKQTLKSFNKHCVDQYVSIKAQINTLDKILQNSNVNINVHVSMSKLIGNMSASVNVYEKYLNANKISKVLSHDLIRLLSIADKVASSLRDVCHPNDIDTEEFIKKQYEKIDEITEYIRNSEQHDDMVLLDN